MFTIESVIVLKSKYYVLIFLLAKHICSSRVIGRVLLVAATPLRRSGFFFLLCRSIVSLFVIFDLLQAVKFFPIQLIQFGVDVLDGVLRSRDNDMLNRIDSSVHHFNDFIQDDKCGLSATSALD